MENPLKCVITKIKKGVITLAKLGLDAMPGVRKIVEEKFPKIQKFNEYVMRETDNSPKYFAFGDWKNLRITPENVKIAGHNFATKKLTKKGKDAYRDSNDYAEKSAVATLLDDFQHAYCIDEPDYYRLMMCEKLDDQVQEYVYKYVFRPTPRLRIDMRKDPMNRYNM